MQLTDNIFIGFIAAGKSEGNVFEEWELKSKHRPRFGRNWWFWLPDFCTNGGRFRPHENTDIQFHWLCFNFYLTVYAYSKRYHE